MMRSIQDETVSGHVDVRSLACRSDQRRQQDDGHFVCDKETSFTVPAGVGVAPHEHAGGMPGICILPDCRAANSLATLVAVRNVREVFHQEVSGAVKFPPEDQTDHFPGEDGGVLQRFHCGPPLFLS